MTPKAHHNFNFYIRNGPQMKNNPFAPISAQDEKSKMEI